MLTVTKPTNGTVTSKPGDIDCGDDCEDDFDDNKKVTLTAEADDSYEFSSWGGACESATDETCVVVMSKDQTVTVAFSKEDGTIPPPATKPMISSFEADPTTIKEGESSTLTWNVTGATSLSVAPGIGTVTGTSTVVSPDDTTEYTLTATNDAGSVTAETTVAVEAESEPPEDPGEGDLKADFEYKASGTKVQFTSNTEGSNGDVLSYSWEFGDGMIGSGPKTTHTYAEAGTYKVFLTARTDDGATSRIGKNVTVTD